MTRATERQLETLRRQLQDEPSHGPGTFRYPRARARKGAEVPPGELAEALIAGTEPGASGVRARFWPFLCDAALATTRTTIVSPPFQGPLLISEIAVRHPGSVGSFGGLALFWSTDSGSGITNGPVGQRPSGTPIFEPASIRSTSITDLDEIPEHIIYASPGSDPTEVVVTRPRRIIDIADRIFLKITIRSHPAGGAHCRGWVIVFEATSVAELLTIG